MIVYIVDSVGDRVTTNESRELNPMTAAAEAVKNEAGEWTGFRLNGCCVAFCDIDGTGHYLGAVAGGRPDIAKSTATALLELFAVPGRLPQEDEGKARVILHFSDWDYRDRYFDAPAELIGELKSRIRADGMSSAWSWWVGLVDREGHGMPEKPIHMHVQANHAGEDELFLDYNNPLECLTEWEAE